MPFYGIKRIPRYPWKGNALTIFDIGPLRGDLGTPPAPTANLPPEIGVDPHPITATELKRRVRVLGLPQGRRRVRGPLPERQALLRGRLDGAMRTLLAIAAAGVVALAAAAPAAAPRAATRSTPRAASTRGPTTTSREHGHLALTASMMPTNAAGTPIEPADYNWSDGFSPGAPIVTKVPGPRHAGRLRQDRRRCRSPTSRARSTADAPIVVINARTLRRQLIWAELDSNASTPADTALLIHPAKNLREGERYIVALRDLRGADGTLLQPSPAFRSYRDRIKTGIAQRSSAAGRTWSGSSSGSSGPASKRRDLYLAWDFTVASAQVAVGAACAAIRDDAFRGLGDTNLGDLR